VQRSGATCGRGSGAVSGQQPRRRQRRCEERRDRDGEQYDEEALLDRSRGGWVRAQQPSEGADIAMAMTSTLALEVNYDTSAG
jgi:hypothetical protein